MSLPEFNTYKVANASDRSKNFKVVTTNHPATNFPIGINMLDIKQKCNPRIRAYADNVSPADSNYDQFVGRINLETWGDTHVYGARCTWLDVSKHSLDFQFGKFSSGGMNAGDTTTAKSIDIQFTRAYHVPPKVVIWLTSLDSNCTYVARINAYADNITIGGFRLRIDTWCDSIIYNATITWIAVPSDNPNMTAGQLVTPGSASSGFQQKLIFDKPFKRVPRVMVAFNKLDVANNANLRITTSPKDITTQGMTLVIESWADTVIFSCAAGYIAIDDTLASRN
ncbi:H-type lectin domain protein [Rhizoctonia solani 123E]|uniref:H-type lectin domain protein n=1 Tax=Rhizoctonia solani 123E TaxID=1423351 RepID=A0A074SI77_9AGAM|nr:H-type lectin domain protein [Rhizoctonia solani 123E]